jgi:hypothetical protein
MDTENPDAQGVDALLGRVLRDSYAPLSRRSFLSALTRKIFALAGVSLVSEVMPFLATEARAADAPTWCGLHGWICESGTTCYGGTPRATWVQCCEIPTGTPPCPMVYTCCRYTDYCAPTRPSNWGTDCHIGKQPCGLPWCGESGGMYLCTTVQCSGNYSTFPQCANGCSQSCYCPRQ